MPKHPEAMLPAAAGCLAGLLLFSRTHSLAWQMYGGLLVLLCAAFLLAAALPYLRGHALRRPLAPARHPARRWVTQGRVVLPLRRR